MRKGALEGKKVLIAEDSWHVAQALRMTVESEGAEMAGPIPTVARACRLLAGSDVDLALVDFNLRDETAAPLLQALAARGIKCVVLSGYWDLGAFRDSAVAVLGKPVQPDGLVRVLRRAFS